MNPRLLPCILLRLILTITPKINGQYGLIKDAEGILRRWQERFAEVLNHHTHVEADSLDNVPAVPVRVELGDVIHINEVRNAAKQMTCNKVSRDDGIPAVVYTHREATYIVFS